MFNLIRSTLSILFSGVYVFSHIYEVGAESRVRKTYSVFYFNHFDSYIEGLDLV